MNISGITDLLERCEREGVDVANALRVMDDPIAAAKKLEQLRAERDFLKGEVENSRRLEGLRRRETAAGDAGILGPVVLPPIPGGQV